MKITIYSVCWNEEVILPFFFQHYKKRFPSASFVFYDNGSNDDSKNIITSNGGKIIDLDTNNKVRDDLVLQIKNNCWKSSENDWVIICDVDEFIDCDEKYLISTDASIIKCEGYDMVGDTFELSSLNRGTRNFWLDKCLLFDPRRVDEINFEPGCHNCNPIGDICYNDKRIILKHYKYFNLSYVLKRFEILAKRLSDENINNGWGLHYQQSRNEIVDAYMFILENSRAVPLPFYYHYLFRLLNNYKYYGIINNIIKIDRPFIHKK